MADARRAIPSVDRLLGSDEFAAVLAAWPRDLVVNAVQDELAVLRAKLRAGGKRVVAMQPAAIAGSVQRALEVLAGGTLVPVINATGVVLHTNLGRAPLAAAALEAMTAVARGYSNLEYDAATGSRGSRYIHCRALLRHLTGAEDALVVNNNAAALVLALNTTARAMDAIVSRGELVEIGGAFRIPEIVARSGARLREVGATNRTHIDDYAAALSGAAGALLKVHPSNFRIEGFTAEVGVRDLAALGAEGGVPLIHDIGSGLLVEPARIGLPVDEPVPAGSLRDGAAIVTMSGDKLLGGPQCGIVLGSASLIDRMRRNPLCRALRVDKLTLAALAATLRIYLDPARALREIPVLRMLSLSLDALETRAAAFAAQCRPLGLDARVLHGTSAVGGGAATAAAIPTALVSIAHGGLSAARLDERLRTGSPAVAVRIVDERVALDLRTVPPDEDAALLRALERAAA